MYNYIDSSIIFKALKYYESKGFELVSVPLTVDKEYSDITKPCNINQDLDLTHLNKVYVASAEQSFIELYENGKLKSDKKYIAITPCYRTENQLDLIHFNLFLKIEFIWISKPNTTLDGCHLERNHLINISKEFFSKFAVAKQQFIGGRERQIDLLINDIEVGSYGIRQMLDGTNYVYGTGLAEPRFSYAVNKGNYRNLF